MCLCDAGQHKDQEKNGAEDGDSKLNSWVLQNDPASPTAVPHKVFVLWLTGPKVTYIPPTLPEDEDSIFAHYETGINFDKYDDIMVDVSGTNPPQAIAVRSAECLIRLPLCL